MKFEWPSDWCQASVVASCRSPRCCARLCGACSRDTRLAPLHGCHYRICGIPTVRPTHAQPDPGGIEYGSRWSSPHRGRHHRIHPPRRMHPEGMPLERSTNDWAGSGHKARKALTTPQGWHPCRGAKMGVEKIRWCRCAQPPATIWDASGIHGDLPRGLKRLFMSVR